MEKYKINGQSITMPTGWHDVRYNDAMNILENQLNDVQVFSLFSGLSEKEVKNLNKEKDIYYFLQGFPFLNKLPIDIKGALPQTIKYKEARYELPYALPDDPYDFGDASVGQIEDMKAIMTKMVTEFLDGEERGLTNLEVFKIYPPLVAIFLHPILEGSEYDYKASQKLADRIQKELSFKEVVYMGAFFLMKLSVLINGSKKGLQNQHWMKRKWQQGYRKLARYLDSMQR